MSEVDPSGAEVLALRLSQGQAPVFSYRVWRHAASLPEAEPSALRPSASNGAPAAGASEPGQPAH